MTSTVPCLSRHSQRLGRALVVALLALGQACSEAPNFQPSTQLVYLNQGKYWGPRERALYYYTPQGTMLHGLRYAWFQHLESPSGERIAAPGNLSRYGFLYSPEQFNPNFAGGKLTPANLPAGFAAHYDDKIGDTVLDVTCALCHTGQLEYRGVSMRVDGGQPMHAFAWLQPGQLLVDMLFALAATYSDPFKFDRFAQNVLGLRYPNGKAELHAKLEEVISASTRELATSARYWKDDGYGRLDALSRIADVVFGDDITLGNKQAANAPVSYPHLWDIWKFDWVQWNGSIAQPMGRNVGEALGVKARVELLDAHGKPLPSREMFDSDVLVRELHCLETTLWQLGPPQWPEDILPAIDEASAGRGRELYQTHCHACHGPHVYPDTPQPAPGSAQNGADQDAHLRRKEAPYECGVRPGDTKPTPGAKPVEWKMCVVPTWEIGTDSEVVNNFLDRRYSASAIYPADPSLAQLSATQGLTLMISKVTEKRYAELGISDAEAQKMNGWGRKNEIRDMRGYKARPLHGVWATPPFLHNGSVRTLYQLLSPQAQREKRFWVGSREFDPVHVGYENRKVQAAYELDTRSLGNHNTGHQFTDAGGPGVIGPALSHQERLDLIEYIKALGHPVHDPDYSPSAPPGPAECRSDIQGPAAHPELKWPL